MEAAEKGNLASEAPVTRSRATSLDQDHQATESDIQAALAEYVLGSKEEKRLVRKIDIYMVPTLWLMCVFSYVDRSNVGNAKAAGMAEDLGLSDSNYSMLISIFFLGYALFEVPSNVLLPRCRPSWYLPSLMVVWGVLVAVTSQVRNYHGILACRLFLGIVESGFLPGVMYLMSCWYKRDEIALCVAGAVGGLLSGAILSGLEGVHGMEGWRWLFLLEGAITVGVAGCCKFILLDYPSTSRRLSREERQLATIRIMHDKRDTVSQGKGKLTGLQAVAAALVDLRTYFFMALYLLNNGSASIYYFIPTVLKDMGYHGTIAQWMTIPIWVVGTVFLVLTPISSDRLQNRNWHVVFGLVTALVSGIIILTSTGNGVRYAFICFFVGGAYSAFPLMLTWASETMALPAEKRAVAIAAVNAVANIAPIYGSYMWPSSDAPEYKPAFTAMVVMSGSAALLAALMPVAFRFMPKFSTKAEKEIQMVAGEAETE